MRRRSHHQQPQDRARETERFRDVWREIHKAYAAYWSEVRRCLSPEEPKQDVAGRGEVGESEIPDLAALTPEELEALRAACRQSWRKARLLLLAPVSCRPTTWPTWRTAWFNARPTRCCRSRISSSLSKRRVTSLLKPCRANARGFPQFPRACSRDSEPATGCLPTWTRPLQVLTRARPTTKRRKSPRVCPGSPAPSRRRRPRSLP